MPEQIRVVIIKDESAYVAQCLEVDIAAQGKSVDDALNRLRTVLVAEIREATSAGRTIYDLGPAPETFEMIHDTNVIHRTTMAAAA